MKNEQSFEQKQEALEAIVRQLEDGNVPLEEMVALYEKGDALYRDCLAALDQYEKRVLALTEETKQ
ncbi:MAG: exodeoxyribonuclease VII small subunit [Clostridia bacterium]|jgi:exodeoxyribonuclease VII small subunit|nr:exodeoxyribonuclease VII small subunit [Clostridia bacterium]